QFEVPDGNKTAANSSFRKTEERLFRAIEYLFRGFGLIKAFRHDLIRRVYKLSKKRFLADDFDVILDIGQTRNTILQACEVCNAACAFKLRPADQFFLNRD